ncbi:MAG: hypothetical protein ABIY55_31850 [Kofleriaceae bacterium]
MTGSRFTLCAMILLAGCAAPQREVAPSAPTAPAPSTPPPSAPDPDLHRPPARRALDIAWAEVVLTDDASALALWARIAPTGADWDDKLPEIPAALARPLAFAVLRGGNFTCSPPATGDCAKPRYDVERPADDAGFTDPCLRRVLALWALSQLDDAELPAIRDAVLAIAAIPPPESELVAAAIHAVPELAFDTRLAVLAVAWRAGQHDLVDAVVGTLDEPHLVAAVRQHHIAGALAGLAAEAQRAVFLAAVTDEALDPRARITAIGELAALSPKLAADLASALVTATRSKDCSVAANAARVLAQHDDPRFVPRRPRTATVAAMMRAACVLASYEALQPSDEPSLLPGYLPARGLERTTITYDALSDDDPDRDGDIHTTHAAELIARDEAVLPELEDLVRAMQHCTGTICVSDEHEFRFVWKPVAGSLALTRIELADRPPCAPAKP